MITLKAIFLGVGLWFAMTQIMGEIWVFRGATQLQGGNGIAAFLDLVRAEAVMPFRYYTREANASVHMVANTLPPEVNIKAINRALEADPYSGNLLWYRIVQELRRGNLKDALASLDTMEKMMPTWPQTQTARRVYDEVEKRIEAINAQK